MNQNVTTLSSGLRYGLMAGVASIIFGLVMYLAGAVDYSTGKQDPVSSVVNILIMIGGIVLAIKYYKDNNGSLTTGEGVGSSFYFGLFYGLLTALWVYLFFTMIDPSVLEVIREAAKENALASGQMSEEDYEQAEGMMNTFTSPGVMSIMTLVWSILLSLIVGLIASLIMKKEPNPLA